MASGSRFISDMLIVLFWDIESFLLAHIDFEDTKASGCLIEK